jgi:hypothetical protein
LSVLLEFHTGSCLSGCTARHAENISQGNTATEHLGVGVLALCYPLPIIADIIASCGKSDKRVRDLAAALMV